MISIEESEGIVKRTKSRHYLKEMREYFIDALILDAENAGDFDRLIYLYTPTLGKVAAKAKSIRKITSKLAGHLEPLSISKIRLVEKNGIQITDAILVRQIEKSPAALQLLQFIKEMTYEFQPDKKLWLILKKSFEDLKNKSFSYKPLLKALGFAPDFAECSVCKNKMVKFFSPKEQVFLCQKCGLKITKDEVVLIE